MRLLDSLLHLVEICISLVLEETERFEDMILKNIEAISDIGAHFFACRSTGKVRNESLGALDVDILLFRELTEECLIPWLDDIGGEIVNTDNVNLECGKLKRQGTYSSSFHLWLLPLESVHTPLSRLTTR
jgi:hypothetical protein